MNKIKLKGLKIVTIIFFFLMTIGIFILSIFFLIEFYKTPELTKDKLVSNVSTRIYDKNYDIVAIIGAERREYVSINDIPDTVKDAVISIEDTRFYNHVGIDPKRIFKALIVNLISSRHSEGGSTITQQVVKQSFLSSEKSYERKIQELFLALELEKRATKDEILEIYLNKNFYSDNQYGIYTASKYFYNKDLKDLTIPQAALLAGIPQSPVNYNPYDNPEASKKRRDTVLYAMYSNGKISKKQYKEYIEVPINDGLIGKDRSQRMIKNIVNPKYSAYVDFVMKEIKNSEIFKDIENPFSLGLNVYTKLDPALQNSVQTMLDTESKPMIKHPSQAAVTVLETKTGLVEAVGGSKNYKYGDFNFATDSKLQPGSSIKPIIDYAPGIEYFGWDSETKFNDSPYRIAGTNVFVQNWDRRYHGNINMRRALSMSYNVPAIRAFESLGFDRSKYFANKLGINIQANMPTTAIGGSTDTVSPLQMAAAYAAFGNGGIYNKPSAIVKILDRENKELIDFKQKPVQAMNASTAYIMTDILKDVLTYNGTSPYGNVKEYDMAAKSGSTTFDDSVARNLGINVVSATKDSWMIGYTTSFTVSVWQGVDTANTKDKAMNINQASTTQLIFAHIMKLAHGDNIPEKFAKPDTVESNKNIYFATDRNSETDDMYPSTKMDAIYQYKLSKKNRDERK